MCCLEKPKGRQKEGRGGGGGGPPCLKTREKGGRERGADRQRRFRGGGEGWLAGWRRGWVVSVDSGAEPVLDPEEPGRKKLLMQHFFFFRNFNFAGALRCARDAR